MNYTLDTDLFIPWFIFDYKGNNNIVLRNTQMWVHLIDIEYDPEFTDTENPIYFISWGTLEWELYSDDNIYLFIKKDYE